MKLFRLPVFVAALSVGGLALWPSLDTASIGTVQADQLDNVMLDFDADLVPNPVEFLLQTDKYLLDSDADGVDDFVEILTFQAGVPNASTAYADHGMRIMMTSEQTPLGEAKVWLHIMLRIVGDPEEGVVIQDLYLAKEGLHLSLIPFLFAGGEIELNSFETPQETRYFLSAQLFSEAELMAVMPCTIGCRSRIGDLSINTGTTLVNAADDIAALVAVPGQSQTFMLQPINISEAAQDASALWGAEQGGRVCQMVLTQIAPGQGGVLWEVSAADCVPAAGLRCPIDCSGNIGQQLFFPDDIGIITGQN